MEFPFSFPELLEYGFLGFAVILMFFAFTLFRDVLKAKTISKTRMWTGGLFLGGALLFLMGAGLLEMLHRSTPVTIVLSVAPWSQDYTNQYGILEVRATHSAKKQSVADGFIRLAVHDDEGVEIRLYNLMQTLGDLRAQVRAERENALPETARNELGTGGGI